MSRWNVAPMHDDLDQTASRLFDNEAHRTRTNGFGTTKQGQHLAHQYRQLLAHNIGIERGRTRRPDGQLAEQLSKWLKVSPSARNVDVLRAIKDLDDEELAFRLLVAGISVSEANNLGADDDGVKNFRATAEWIGRNLGQQRGELCVKVGAWGINRLIELRIFALDA